MEALDRIPTRHAAGWRPGQCWPAGRRTNHAGPEPDARHARGRPGQ